MDLRRRIYAECFHEVLVVVNPHTSAGHGKALEVGVGVDAGDEGVWDGGVDWWWWWRVGIALAVFAWWARTTGWADGHADPVVESSQVSDICM